MVRGALGRGPRAARAGSWLCLGPQLFPSLPEVLSRQVQGVSLIPLTSPGATSGASASLTEISPWKFFPSLRTRTRSVFFRLPQTPAALKQG